MNFWYLDENRVPHPLPMEQLTEYLKANGDPRRQVARSEPMIGTTVSTVFLAHAAGLYDKDPVLFETMIFSESDTELKGDAERYHTWDEAVAGHAKWCKHVVDVLIGDANAGDLE